MGGGTPVPEGDFGPPIEFDPNFNGPVHKRSCTDIICLIIFIAFVVCWGFVCGFAFISGDVSRLLAPTDSQGQRCGFTEAVKDDPYLVFFDFSKCLDPEVALFGCRTRQMCVKQCPTTTRYWDLLIAGPVEQFNAARNELVCERGIDVNTVTQLQLQDYILNETCARYNFKSKSVSMRCIPSNLTEIGDAMLPNFTAMSVTSRQSIVTEWTGYSDFVSKANEVGAMIVEDLVNLKWWLLLALFVVMVICMIYIAIMRWIAGPVVWFSLVALVGLLSWSIYLCYTNYVYYRDEIKEPNLDTSISGLVDSLFAQKTTWIILLIASCISLAIILIMVIFLRNRIVIAIALIKEGSKAVSSVLSTLFFPVFPWILEILVLALAVSACLFLTTIGEDRFQVRKSTVAEPNCPYKNGDTCTMSSFSTTLCPESTCIYTGVINDPVIPWMQAWNVIGFFWVLFFIQGVGEMILAGVFATWYWTFHKGDVPFFTLTRSIARTMFFNLGTVAFGSLIITICRLIRVAIEYVDQQCKKYDNFLTKCLLCCCRCFFACLESFLRFINKNAFIMCAVHGKGFCASARDAFDLLMRNIIRVVVLDKVTDFLFFLSKLVVAIGCGAAAYFIFRDPTVVDATAVNLHYDMVPALIVGIIAYFIACIFFGVYSMAVDTLFLCFLEDIERNDGSPERPYFMSKNLMKILGKKNK